jgi:molybdate transport system substrate-binding protein
MRQPDRARGKAATLLAAALATLSLPTGCQASSGSHKPAIVVLAAASLTEVFREIGAAYESERERPVRLSFAGSQTLATQLREGVRADVVAVADPEILADLVERDLVARPRQFATSRIVWVLRRGPAGAQRRDPMDLASSNWQLVLASPEVPAGAYARRALDALGLREAAEARVVSYELDVRGVTAKLRLAGADLGMVYATDVRPDDPDLEVVELPPGTRVLAGYGAGLVREAAQPDGAVAFLDFLDGPRARQILARAGFGTP